MTNLSDQKYILPHIFKRKSLSESLEASVSSPYHQTVLKSSVTILLREWVSGLAPLSHLDKSSHNTGGHHGHGDTTPKQYKQPAGKMIINHFKQAHMNLVFAKMHRHIYMHLRLWAQMYIWCTQDMKDTKNLWYGNFWELFSREASFLDLFDFLIWCHTVEIYSINSHGNILWIGLQSLSKVNKGITNSIQTHPDHFCIISISVQEYCTMLSSFSDSNECIVSISMDASL